MLREQRCGSWRPQFIHTHADLAGKMRVLEVSLSHDVLRERLDFSSKHVGEICTKDINLVGQTGSFEMLFAAR
jgi:hypothetical protein